jgi:hypothetical protein
MIVLLFSQHHHLLVVFSLILHKNIVQIKVALASPLLLRWIATRRSYVCFICKAAAARDLNALTLTGLTSSGTPCLLECSTLYNTVSALEEWVQALNFVSSKEM